MRSLLEELGDDTYQSVADMLNEYVDRVIQGATTSTGNEDFAQYRATLNAEYADSLYRLILRGKRSKRK